MAESRSGKAVLVTQWFPPEPSHQPLRLARAMRASGFDVEVMTGVPNYPSGSVFEGYRAREFRTEEIEGFTVRRSPLLPSHDQRPLMRILNYLSWAISATVSGLRHLRGADVALVYGSPATAALPALLARRLFGTPFVLLVQDVWPDSIFSSGFMQGRLARPLHRIVDAFVQSIYRSADHVAVISPGMATLLKSRGVPAGKLSLLYNAVDEAEVRAQAPVERSRWGLEASDFVVSYAGNHGAAQDLRTVIRGVAGLPASSRVHLVMIGDGVEKAALRRLANEIAPDRVHFEQPVPRSALTAFTAAADAQLVSLADRPLFRVTMPSKVQSALAAGQPVVVVGNGDVSDVVAEAGAGVVAAAGSAPSVTEALLALSAATAEERRHMGLRGRAFYDAHMSAAAAQGQLGRLLRTASERGLERRRFRSRERTRQARV